MSSPTDPLARGQQPPLETGAGPVRGTTYVPSTPEHVLWGRLPCAADEPVERVEPGTEVTFDTVSHEGILEDQGRDPEAFFAAYDVEHVLSDAVAIAATDASTHPRTFGVDGPHVVSRPSHVAGARPGDLLAVTVLETLPRVPYGVISNRHGKGALPGEYPLDGEVFSAFAAVDDTGTRGCCRWPPARSRRSRFPLAPFLGIIGVAVAGDERPHSVPPGPHGGNIDINLLTVGSTLYLPVQVEGALVSTSATRTSRRATARWRSPPWRPRCGRPSDSTSSRGGRRAGLRRAGRTAGRDGRVPGADRARRGPGRGDGELRACGDRPAAGPLRHGPEHGASLPQRGDRLRHLPGGRPSSRACTPGSARTTSRWSRP